MKAFKASEGELFAELRAAFLLEGQKEVRLLSRSMESEFEAAEARKIVHHWVGCGGFLGFPQITEWAAEIQALLRRPGGEAGESLRAGFDRMAELFAELERQNCRVSGGATERADPLLEKKFAAIGFPPPEAEGVARVLEQAHAFCRCFGCEEAPPGCERLGSFDAVVVNLCAEGERSPWMNPGALEGNTQPILVVGSRDDLAEHRALYQSQVHDFLVTPWHPAELLLRARQVVSPGARPSAGRLPAKRNAKPRVVLADDDPTITAVLRTTLENHGMECHVASHGGEALELTRKLRPTVLVLDLMMPKLDGFEVLTHLKSDPSTKEIPVVLLTVRQQEVDIMRGFNLGADEYITKPFNPMEVVARLRRLIRTSAPVQSGARAEV